MESSKPITNLALGYRWLPKEDLMVLAGFRTDFSSHKKPVYKNELVSKEVKSFHPDRYHITGGLNLTVFGQDLMAGLQYTLGLENNEKQFINLSHPVEYNPDTYQALQGEIKINRSTVLNSISLYFGATINFGTGKKDK
jgi:hypothetical protein